MRSAVSLRLEAAKLSAYTARAFHNGTEKRRENMIVIVHTCPRRAVTRTHS